MIDLARTLSDTFAGIAPASVPMFLLMQFVGGAAGVAVIAVLYTTVPDVADAVVVPRDSAGPADAEALDRPIPRKSP
jgi:membrane protein DedA with SNARE-associated domain